MELRGEQPQVDKKVDELFWGIDSKRFAGIIATTGGGKTYLFLSQFLKFLQKYADEKDEAKPQIEASHMSNIPTYFFAPQNPILDQTKDRIVEYVILDKYIETFNSQYMNLIGTEEYLQMAVEKISARIVKSSKRRGKKKEELDKTINDIYKSVQSNSELSDEEKLEEIITQITYVIGDDTANITKSEFPNLFFKCYQNKDDVENLLEEISNKEEPVLIVIDEAHRAVTPENGKKIEELIRRCSTTKVLALTATTDRSDGIDAMARLAQVCGYSIPEIRKEAYLASNLTLVDAIKKDLIVKPKVVTFDLKLDETHEYADMKAIVGNLKKKVEEKEPSYKEYVMKHGSYSNTALKKIRERDLKLIEFYEACKITGKNEFLKELLSEEIKELSKTESEDPIIQERLEENQSLLKYMLEKADFSRNISQQNLLVFFERIDEMDSPGTEFNKKYVEWKRKKISEIIKNTAKEHEYILNSKGICFTPRSNKNKSSKKIIDDHKKIMKEYFQVEDENILVTHSNKSVVPEKEDKKNLRRFMAPKNPKESMLIIVAMDRFTEGIHSEGVKMLSMFRQFDEKKQKDETEDGQDPCITFLQQIGRGITTKKDGEIVDDIPVIFDFACNFMRFNPMLENSFEISESQTRFKQIAEKILVTGEKQFRNRKIKQKFKSFRSIIKVQL